MTNGAETGIYGGAAVAAYAAMMNAIKAFGPIVHVEPNNFMDLLGHAESLLVVYAPAKFWGKHKYMTSYKGLFFYTKAATLLNLPAKTEVVQAKKICFPA